MSRTRRWQREEMKHESHLLHFAAALAVIIVLLLGTIVLQNVSSAHQQTTITNQTKVIAGLRSKIDNVNYRMDDLCAHLPVTVCPAQR